MKNSPQAKLRIALLLIYAINILLVPAAVWALPKGTVDCVLEWHTSRQTYTYVFSGVVSHLGRPCPNAKIQVQLSVASQPDKVQETLASADGTYQLKLSISGNPEEATDWKLIAQMPETGLLSPEIAGRAILMDSEETVKVNRSIQMVQG
jgi:hypothetical protein